MADPFIGEIRIFACNYNPSGWAFCNGGTLPLAQYAALASILGSTYGQATSTQFYLPDLRARAPVHMGQGPGLSYYQLGKSAGATTATIANAQMPVHNHSITADSNTANQDAPTAQELVAVQGKAISSAVKAVAFYKTQPLDNTKLVPLHGLAVSPTQVGGVAHENRQPFLALNFSIALLGEYPVRP